MVVVKRGKIGVYPLGDILFVKVHIEQFFIGCIQVQLFMKIFFMFIFKMEVFFWEVKRF